MAFYPVHTKRSSQFNNIGQLVHVVGVTVDETAKVEDVLLKVDNKLWPYIETKPINGSQKVIERNDEWVLVKLELQPNYELETILFFYAEQIEI